MDERLYIAVMLFFGVLVPVAVFIAAVLLFLR
jgi:hypothetical protein